MFVAFCFLSIANGQIINFSDANFKAKLLAASNSNTIARNLSNMYFKIDSNSNNEIEFSEALNVRTLNVTESGINNLQGIDNFTNLYDFYCGQNPILTLNINGLANLNNLNCVNGVLTSINLTGLTGLYSLWCNNNNIISINLSGSNLTNIGLIYCQDNQLTSLDVTGLTTLYELVCFNNQLVELNLSGLASLNTLNAFNNKFTTLNFAGLSNLGNLFVRNNFLTSLDLRSCGRLYNINCSNNLINTILIKNGSYENGINFSNNPLTYICVDEFQVSNVQDHINSIYLANPYILNSYCSTLSGNSYFSIYGNIKLDQNINGCDLLDLNLLNFKLNITNNLTSVLVNSNNFGNYSIPVQAGTHTITPILENPTYFNVSPTSATITFPATASPATRDFCITANGVHNDLEISLLPIDAARPGFDASYKLVYKNKGNQTQSGAVGLTFNDAVLDFVTTNPATTSQIVNNLSWSFVDLKPFESREIAVTLNANSPMETPALNGGSILSFTANVTSTNDETPNDNIAILNQTVVNSFDPNDKTCLEGNNIVPAKVGDYVHYMIRFENIGTFAAQNIVVKDMIDLAKFDIASLIPVKGSHDFYTRINGNKVEFIFENINLPFADATNDGYVAFKIKTKSTLVLGNTFSNSANIYFDYNFPIVTNTATTTVANQLATQDFEFSKYFSIYPNPAKNILNLETKSGATISSLSIYNTLGQLVQVITSPNKTIDVSELKSGNYFIKTVSDKGTSNSKFLKE